MKEPRKHGKNGQRKYLHPETGEEISHQRHFQLQNRQKGLCELCSNPAHPSSVLCLDHLKARRKRNRKTFHYSHSNPRAWVENKPTFQGADWSLNNVEIAKQYRTTPAIVRGWRKIHGIEGSKAGRPKKKIK